METQWFAHLDRDWETSRHSKIEDLAVKRRLWTNSFKGTIEEPS